MQIQWDLKLNHTLSIAQSITYQLSLITACSEVQHPCMCHYIIPLNTTRAFFSPPSAITPLQLFIHYIWSCFKASLSVRISHYFIMPHIFLTPYCDGGSGLLATSPLRGGDSIWVGTLTSPHTPHLTSPPPRQPHPPDALQVK